MLVTNAFSLNMLSADSEIRFSKITKACAAELLHLENWESCVGHADTARVFSDVLGVEIPANRATVSFDGSQKMIVGQYKGPRLPEGATKLPEGATIEWWLVQDAVPLALKKEIEERDYQEGVYWEFDPRQ